MRLRLLDSSRSIAWVLWSTAAGMSLTYLILVYLDRTASFNSYGLPGMDAVVQMSTATFGALILGRHPKNSMGWILISMGLAGLLADDAQLYSVLANTVRHGTLPAGIFSAWLGSWLFTPGISLLVTLVLLLFPDGRLPSPRWRFVAWPSGVVVVVATVAIAIGAIPRRGDFRIDAGGTISGSQRTWDNQEFTLLPLVFGLFCLAGLIVRFRRSSGEERQQLKWFAYGGVLFVAGFVVVGAAASGPAAGASPPRWATIFLQITTVCIPVAIGIAVMKYRLYDIDIVISRTRPWPDVIGESVCGCRSLVDSLIDRQGPTGLPRQRSRCAEA